MKKFYSCLLATALLLSTSYAQTIRPEFPYPNGEVQAIVKYGNTIYIGGSFTSLTYPSGATYPRQNLAAFDASTGSVLPWNPGVARLQGPAYVMALAAKNNVIYIGGSFSSVGGQLRSNIAAVDAVTGTTTAWNPAIQGQPKTILATATRVYVGGYLDDANNIVVLDAISGQHLTFYAGINDDVFAMALKDSTLFVGGRFTKIGSEPRYYVGALNANSGATLPWNPAPDWSVFDLKLKDNKLFIGGAFLGLGYNPPGGIAVAPPQTGQSSLPRQAVAAVDPNTDTLLPWDPKIFGGWAEAIDIHGSNLYIGGLLNKIDGHQRKGLAMVDATTGALSDWDPDPLGIVYKILALDSTVFVSGNFTSIAGKQRNYFAALTAPASAPVITCPSNITVSNAPGLCSQSVTLNAIATGSNPSISYEINGMQTSNSAYTFPVGTTVVKATATNTIRRSDCSFTVTVNDTQAPTIGDVTTSTAQLWPVNHKMKEVTLFYTTTDNCPQEVSTQLSITSNEPTGGDDWKVIDNRHIQLKAERSGNGNGRIYTITVTATDQHGNHSSRSTTVSVPHDQSKSGTTRLEGPTQTANSELLVRAQATPAHNYFVLTTQSGNMNQKIALRLYDVNGRLVEARNAIPGETVQMGKLVNPGFYLLEYGQGGPRKQISLIKQ